jgi:hypothetical protein
MRGFRANEGENERTQEETRDEEANLISEETIIKDKERFGRVRNSLMKYLRVKYGRRTANRALWRVNKRMLEGYLTRNVQDQENRFRTDMV